MKSRRLATYATSLIAFVPAPPVVHYVYGPIDPSLNADGEMVSAYADTATSTVHLLKDPSPLARGHETGHIFDAEILTDGDRVAFQKLMHAPAGPWDHGATYGKVDGDISPNEWFADFYGAAASRLDGLNGRSTGTAYATITPKRMKHFEKALARLAKRRGLTQPYQP